MASAAERKFINLRKRLDQFGYRQPLAMESLPLVEALFGDLLQTTESLRQNKMKMSKQQDLEGTWETNIEPYRTENARLVRENNELHQGLLKTREKSEEKVRELKVTLRRLEHENADLRFLNNQYVHKVRSHEKQSRSKDDKIAQLQEKNLQAVVQTPGGRKKQIPFRRQRMEIDASLPASVEAREAGAAPPDPFYADMVKVADQRMEQLRVQVARLEESERSSGRAIQSLRKQVETRDKEIERLTRMLEGGRPSEVVLTEGKRETNEKLVAHLNIQVDYLQQTNTELQHRLNEMQETNDETQRVRKDLVEKNAKLCGELHEINELTRQMEDEKRTRLKELENELKMARHMNDERGRALVKLKREFVEMKREHKSLLIDGRHTADMLAAAEDDVKRANHMIDRLEREKKEMEEKCHKLEEREKTLSFELERLHHVATLREEDRARRTKAEHDRIEGVLDGMATQADQLSRERDELSDVTHSMEKRFRHVEDEKNYYKEECMRLQDTLKKRAYISPSSSPRRGLVQTGSPPIRVLSDITETADVVRLRVERDQLAASVRQFQADVEEIRSDLRILSSDRDNFKLLYEQSSDEVRRLRHELTRKMGTAPLQQTTTHTIIRQIERERDEAREESRRLRVERDSLQDRLKISTETEKASREVLEQKAVRAEVEIKDVLIERDELSSRVKSLRDIISHLEDQIKSNSASLTAARHQTTEMETRVEEMKALADHAETARQEQARQLKKCELDVEETERKIRDREAKIESLEGMLKASREEATRLQDALHSLDRQRDSVQDELDVKTETLFQMKKDKQSQEETEKQLQLNIREMHSQLSARDDLLLAKDREINSLRHQMDACSTQLEESRQGREIAVADNRRLQQDLRTMTQENQAVHHELNEVTENRDLLKLQVQQYAQGVVQYQSALDEKEKIELQHLNQQQVAELTEKDKAIQSYGIQVAKFTTALSRMEQELRQLRDEKRVLLEERNAAHTLCTRLEQDRNTITRQLAERSASGQQMQIALDSERLEVKALKREVEHQAQHIQGLEGLLAAERQKMFHHQLHSEQHLSQNEQLQHQITHLEKERQQSLRELAAVQEQLQKSPADSPVGSRSPTLHVDLPLSVSPTSTVAAVTASVTMASQTHTAVTEARNLDDNEDEQSERNYSDSLVTQGSVSPLSSVSSITPGKMRSELAFDHERQTMEDESARLVTELMSSHSSSSSSAS